VREEEEADAEAEDDASAKCPRALVGGCLAVVDAGFSCEETVLG